MSEASLHSRSPKSLQLSISRFDHKVESLFEICLNFYATRAHVLSVFVNVSELQLQGELVEQV